MAIAKEKLGYVEGWASIVINTLLFGIKFWAGSVIGSVSMVADAWHTLSDTLTSIVVIVGFWIMSKPADKEHPYGHARAENISAIIIGVLLAVVGCYFGWESLDRLIHRQSVTFSLAAIVIFGVSVLFKEGLAQFAFWAGKKANAQSVVADGWHHRSDAIASALIVVGALLGGKLWWMDGVLGIGVACLIIGAAVSIIKETSSTLLGQEVPEETRAEIAKVVAKEVPDVAASVHHLHMHSYGGTVALTLHLKLADEMSLKDAHGIGDRVEKRILQDLKLHATVHIEPLTDKDD